MEDTPLVEGFAPETATDRLMDAMDLDRAGNALDMRRARLLAVIKRKDLAPLGYGTFRAFCAEHVDAGDTRIRQLIALAESPFARVRAAVLEGKLAPSVAARGVRDISPENEAAWLESAIAGDFRRKRREPDPEVEFTQPDAKDITNARTLARLNLGQPVSEPVADRHILGAWRARVPMAELERPSGPEQNSRRSQALRRLRCVGESLVGSGAFDKDVRRVRVLARQGPCPWGPCLWGPPLERSRPPNSVYRHLALAGNPAEAPLGGRDLAAPGP